MDNKSKKSYKELEKENKRLKKELEDTKEDHRKSNIRSMERREELEAIIYGDPNGPNPNDDGPTIQLDRVDWDGNGMSY